MPARLRAAKAQSTPTGRAAAAIGNPPSSVGRPLPPPTDEVAGLDEKPFLQLADGRPWPARFGAERHRIA